MYNFDDNTLTEINGSVIYCDDMIMDPVLNHQAIDLACIEDYEVSPLHCPDTIENIVGGVDQAWKDGYEHVIVVTDPSQVEATEDRLLDLFENMFESIYVVSKKSSLKEQDVITPTQTTQTAQSTPPQQTQAQPAQNQGITQEPNQQVENPTEGKKKAAELILLRANPPLKGFGAMLQEVVGFVKGKPDTYIILHNLGISQYIIKGENKYDILFSGKLGSTLYGNMGTTAIAPNIDFLEVDKFKFANSSQELTNILTSLVDANTIIRYPKGIEPQIKNLFPQNSTMKFIALQSADVDSVGNHEKILLLGAKIAQESLVTGKKRDEIESKAGEGNKEAIELLVKDEQENKKEELTAHDRSMMMLLSVFDKVFKNEPIDSSKITSWFGMTKEMQEFLDELANQSGIGPLIAGIKGIKQAVAGEKDTSGDGSSVVTDMYNNKDQKKQQKERDAQQKERDKQQKEREAFNKATRENLGLDAEAVLKHPHYKEFKSFFDDSKS